MRAGGKQRLKVAQRFLVVDQIFNTVSVVEDVSPLQEALELKSRQSQELAGLVMRQFARTVSFNSQSLKGFTARVFMLSEIVRELNHYLHNRIMRLEDEIQRY